MKHVAATVLTLCLMATGSAVAAPNNDRGPQHGPDHGPRKEQPARAGQHGQPPAMAPRAAPHGPQHGPQGGRPPVVQHGPQRGHGPMVHPGPRHAPPPPAPPRHVVFNPRRGDRLPPNMRGYRVNDWRHAGLRQPPRGHEWRRIDGRDLLVAVATGVIADIIYRSY